MPGVAGVRISKGARYGKEFVPARILAKDADTIALYLFNEGQEDILNDASGNGFHGKIKAAKWVKLEDSAGSTPPPAIAPVDAAKAH